jgi:hypothetical protein
MVCDGRGGGRFLKCDVTKKKFLNEIKKIADFLYVLLIMRHILLRQNKFVKLRSLRFGEA